MTFQSSQMDVGIHYTGTYCCDVIFNFMPLTYQSSIDERRYDNCGVFSTTDDQGSIHYRCQAQNWSYVFSKQSRTKHYRHKYELTP